VPLSWANIACISSAVKTVGMHRGRLACSSPSSSGNGYLKTWQISEACLDLGFGGEEADAGPHAVEAGESSDPLHIGALGMDGVVMETEHPADVTEQFWKLTWCCVRHIRSPSRHFAIADNRYGAKLPENLAVITLSGQNGKLINGSAPGIKARPRQDTHHRRLPGMVLAHSA